MEHELWIVNSSIPHVVLDTQPALAVELELTFAGCIENDFKTIIPYCFFNLTHTLVQVTQS